MPSITDWITAVAGLISAGAIVLLWRQTKHAGRQVDLLIDQNKNTAEQARHAAEQVKLLADDISFDHERSRRENAVNLIHRWIDTLPREMSATRKLVESLSPEEARLLNNEKALTLKCTPERLSFMQVYLAQANYKYDIDEARKEITIPEEAVSWLRWQAVKYLNTLESIMGAWHHGVADKDIIAEEFGYLLDEQRGYDAMEKFRGAIGHHAFPAINAFIEHLRVTKTKKAATPGRLPIGK